MLLKNGSEALLFVMKKWNENQQALLFKSRVLARQAVDFRLQRSLLSHYIMLSRTDTSHTNIYTHYKRLGWSIEPCIWGKGSSIRTKMDLPNGPNGCHGSLIFWTATALFVASGRATSIRPRTKTLRSLRRRTQTIL